MVKATEAFGEFKLDNVYVLVPWLSSQKPVFSVCSDVKPWWSWRDDDMISNRTRGTGTRRAQTSAKGRSFSTHRSSLALYSLVLNCILVSYSLFIVTWPLWPLTYICLWNCLSNGHLKLFRELNRLDLFCGNSLRQFWTELFAKLFWGFEFWLRSLEI